MKLRSINRWFICSKIVLGAVLFGLVSTQIQASTHTVISLADNGPGSIREAITNAADGDTIIFDPVLTGKTIVLTNGELLVNKSLTITGLGAAKLSLSGNNTNRVFHVTGTTSAISDLTILAGTAGVDNGGGIYNEAGSTLTIAACVLTGNSGTTGGGIYNAGTLLVNGSTIATNNSAVSGGGIGNVATLTITNITLAGNASTLGGAIYSASGTASIILSTLSGNTATNGGGIYNDAGSTLTVSGGTVSGNSGGTGGGILNVATLTVDGSTLTNNTAISTGGGIANAGTLTLTNGTLAGNSSTLGGAVYSTNGTATVMLSMLADNTATNGGGIYNDAGSTLTVSGGSVLSGNGGANGGGILNVATLTVDGSTLTNNTAINTGGGIANAGTLTLTNGTLAGNSSTLGGAVYNTNGTATVILSTLAGNTATNGGGIYNDQGGAATVAESTLASNSGGTGGGIFNTATLAIYRSTLAGNIANVNDGGGLYNSPLGQATVALSTLANNSATVDGGGLANFSTVTLAESTLAGNSALGGGGGFANFGGVLTIDNTILATNGLAGGNCTNDLGGTVTSRGHNLSNDSTGTNLLTQASDLNNADAGLDPLGLWNNGGPTQTIGLTPVSDAIAAGGPVYPPFSVVAGGGEAFYPPFTDQRGLARFACGKMDIGAYQVQTQTNTPPLIALIGPSLFTNQCSFPVPGAIASNVCGTALNLAAGGAHSLTLKTDGSVAAWGDHAKGQTTVPDSVIGTVAIAAGGSHSLALLNDGAVIPWGDDDYGLSPIPANVTNVMAIAAGDFHSLAVLGDKTVFGWGDNTFNQTNVPAAIVTNAVAVAAGRYHSLALQADGTVVAWGGGTFVASPEDGINYGQANPVGLSNIVVAIAAGGYHSLALWTNGTVKAWGAGSTNLSVFVDFGQSQVPVGLSNVVAIAAGGYHSMALQSDGTIVAWGLNNFGQTNVPPNLTNAVAIAAGTYHSLAITTDGTVVGWGLNSNGQTVADVDLNADLTFAIVTNASGPTAGVGTYTITYSIVGSGGLTSSTNRTVVTVDTLPPVPDVALLPTITNQCSVTLVAPTATDACAGTIQATTAATTYNTQGTFSVTWTYADGHGNSTNQQQTVVIADTLPPVPNVASLPTITNACSVTLSAPTATDNCAGTITATTPNPTNYNTQGAFSVTWTYADGHGNSTNQQQTVVIADTLPPVPNVPSLPTITNSCSVTLVPPTAHDDCAGTITGTTADPTTYIAPGTFDVTWNYTDGHGNSTNQLQTVVITRVSPPLIVCSHDIVLSNNVGPCGTTVVYPVPVITPNCPGNVITRTTGLASGSVFPPGVTYITNQVIDVLGKTNTCGFTVNIVVSRPPSLACPDNITVPTAPGQCQSGPVHFAPTVTDNCPGVTVVCVPTNGAVFARGTNTVVCTATAFGLTNSCSFTVTVVDQETPTISGCPSDIVTNALSLAGTPVTFVEPTASDNCSNVIPVVHAPGSLVSGDVFPIGDTEVVRLATDPSGNQSVCVFTVRVLGPQGSFESLLHDLAVLRDATAMGSGGRQLSQVINNLHRANQLWRLDGRLDARSGRNFFKRTQSAERLLLKLLKGRHDTIPDATLRSLVDRLSTVDRLLALIAINDVPAAGRANLRAIARAKRDEIRGETDDGHGNRVKAIGHYQRAWQTAVKALAKIN